jgi:hypothetical protein
MSEPSRNNHPPGNISRTGPAVIICERTGEWAIAWRRVWSRRASGSGPIRLIETRSASHCRDALADVPEAFTIVELAPSACDAALDLLRDILFRFPRAPCAVVADDRLRGYEWLARELGALDFITTPLTLDRLCLPAARHLARWRPPREYGRHEDLAQRLWDELPWKA